MRKTIILFLFTFVSFVSAQTVPYKIETISLEEGLPGTTVEAIMQDHQGFIWFGTWNGLCRYDGYSFKIYQLSRKNLHTINSNVVRCMVEDREGILWIGTENGLNRFDPIREEFTGYINNPQDSTSISDNIVYDLYLDKRQQLWVCTRGGGLNRFDGKTGKFIRYYKKNSSAPRYCPSYYAFGITEDCNGNYYIAGDKGLFRFSSSEYAFNKVQLTADQNEGFISVVYSKESNRIYAGTWNGGLFILSLSDHSVRHITAPQIGSNIIMSLSEDNGKIYIGTWQGGLSIYDERLDHFETLRKKDGLPDNTILSAFKDKQGLLWVGSEFGGVSKLVKEQNRFFSLRPSDFFSSDNNVMAITTDAAGHLWIGMRDGSLYSYDKKEFRSHISNLGNGLVHSVYALNIYKENGREVLLVGSVGKETVVLDPLTQNTIKVIPVGSANAFLVKDSLVYAGASFNSSSFDGFGYFNLRTGRMQRIDYSKISALKVPYIRVYSLANDKKGNIWVGTKGNGLLKYEANKQHMKVYNTSTIQAFPNDDIYSIYEDDNGTIWSGTGGGLFKLNPVNDSLTVYTENDGLSNNIVYGLLADSKNEFWLSTANGITKFNPSNGDCRRYTKKNGLPSNGYNFGAHHKDRNGLLYFGGTNGVTFFNPDSIREESFIPPVYLTGLTISNKAVSLLQAGNKFNYDQRNISFEFAALDYSIPSNIRYSYRLNGFSLNWNNVNATQRKAVFTNLQPGKYLFEVKASNSEGTWNDKATKFYFEILPPFWMTWWFRLFMVMIIFSGIVAVIIIRTRQIRNTRRLLEREVRERTAEIIRQKDELQAQSEYLIETNRLMVEKQEEISAQAEELSKLNKAKDKLMNIIAHDLKNPLQGILGGSELLLSQKAGGESRHEQISLIHDSSRQATEILNNLLQWGRAQAGKMEVQPVCFDLHELSQKTIRFYAVLTANKKLEIINKIREGTIVFADQTMMATVLQNLTDNAIKFSKEGGRIIFSSEIDNALVKINITDDGTGMPEDIAKNLFTSNAIYTTAGTKGEKGTGLGLSVCKEFVEKNGGSIHVSSSPGKGSTFSFTVPFSEIKEIKDENPVQINNPISTPKENKRKPVLLIADDHQHIRIQIKDYFSNVFEIIEASDGDEAMRYIFDVMPDCIISDVTMPGMDGISLCSRIKSDERTSHIPFLLLTAHDTNEDKIEGYETGADDYLNKPVELSVLKSRVINLLRQREKLRESLNHNSVLANEISIHPLDEKFLKKVTDLIEKNLANESYSVEEFGRDLGLSAAQLYRKMTGLTGLSANEYIRNFRLKKAAQLLKDKTFSVTEVVYAVGFNSPSYFTKCFRDLFGVTPSDYCRN